MKNEVVVAVTVLSGVALVLLAFALDTFSSGRVVGREVGDPGRRGAVTQLHRLGSFVIGAGFGLAFQMPWHLVLLLGGFGIYVREDVFVQN